MSHLPPIIDPEKHPKLEGVKWRFVKDHWDFHIAGIVVYQGEFLMCRVNDYRYTDFDCYVVYRIPKDKMDKILVEMKEFEEYVGRHWSYDEAGNSLKYSHPFSAAEKPNHLSWYTEERKANRVDYLKELKDNSEIIGTFGNHEPHYDDED